MEGQTIIAYPPGIKCDMGISSPPEMALPPDNLYRDMCVGSAPLNVGDFDPKSGELLETNRQKRFEKAGDVVGSKPMILQDPVDDPFAAGPMCMPMKNTPLNPLTVYADSAEALSYAFGWFMNIGNRTTEQQLMELGRLYKSTTDVTRKSINAISSALGCKSMLYPAFDPSGDPVKDIPRYATFWNSVFENCNDQYIVQRMTHPEYGMEPGGPLDPYFKHPAPTDKPTDEQNKDTLALMGMYCQPLMAGDLSQDIYKGARTFRDVGYDHQDVTSMNPLGNPVGYAPVAASSDMLVNEDEYTEDWTAKRAWQQTLQTGKVDSNGDQPSFYPEAKFWPMYYTDPNNPTGGYVPPGTGQSPVAITTPPMATISLPCIKRK